MKLRANEARAIKGAVTVIYSYLLDGEYWLEVAATDHKNPAALEFQGRRYGYTGWNSDRGRAYYKAGQDVAVVV
jgi:hypothetical protein